MENCRICSSQSIASRIDFGEHSISHNFCPINTLSYGQPKVSLALTQCATCQTIQLEEAPQLESMRFNFDWLRQGEPEAHLNEVAQSFLDFREVNTNYEVYGLSYKDSSLVDRFSTLGFSKSRTLNHPYSIGGIDQSQNVVYIQNALSKGYLDSIFDTDQKQSVLICRHLLEHSHNPYILGNALAQTISEDSFLITEIPIFERNLAQLDYSIIWEEHLTYFTQKTFESFISSLGLQIVWSKVFSYGYEDCLVAFIKRKPHKIESSPPCHLQSSENYLEFFSSSFTEMKKKVCTTLDRFKKDQKKIALYGSGHVGNVFLNLFGVHSFFEFVIDDNPVKKNMSMPGSNLKIKDSGALYKEKIAVCLTAMSMENEEKVMEEHAGFISFGGQFFPVSSCSERNFLK